MVIGNGLVAKAFKQYESSKQFLIFASGVSNSKSGLLPDYQREKRLLTEILEEHPEKIFVYFSTCGIIDPDLMTTPYILHKAAMEDILKRHAKYYHIFRLSNLAGFSKNPNTLLNFFNQRIAQGLPFEFWRNAERNIIDVEDTFKIADHILQNALYLNKTINIANTRNYPVNFIVSCFETFYKKKALALEKEKGSPFKIPIREILHICELLSIRFGERYLPDLLNKYYS